VVQDHTRLRPCGHWARIYYSYHVIYYRVFIPIGLLLANNISLS